MLDIYRVTGSDVTALIQLAREARRKPCGTPTAGSCRAAGDYIGLETEAARSATSAARPCGLLQTGITPAPR